MSRPTPELETLELARCPPRLDVLEERDRAGRIVGVEEAAPTG
jgi:hypothetical protein